MSERINKVNSLLEREIGQILAKDFNFNGVLVTLTHVDTTANLIEAKAYISVFPEDKTDGAMVMLSKGVYDVQQKINKMLNMRPIPKIMFIKDKVIAEAAKVEELLEKLKKEQR